MPKHKEYMATEALRSIEKLKCTWRKDYVTLGRLCSGHHPNLKYWLAKIRRATDIVCQKCGLETRQRSTSSKTTQESTASQLNHHPQTRWRKTPHLPYASEKSGSLSPTLRMCPNFIRYSINPSISLLNNNNSTIYTWWATKICRPTKAKYTFSLFFFVEI